ncbi:MAG: hypothetical protein ACI9OJ_005647, partial [Myxococcota bacterium]
MAMSRNNPTIMTAISRWGVIGLLLVATACSSGTADTTASTDGEDASTLPDIVVNTDTGTDGIDAVSDVLDDIGAEDVFGDVGTDDTGILDAGPEDIGPNDTGPEDTGPMDVGPNDTGPIDGGPTDVGPQDSGPTDTGPVDTGADDTGDSPGCIVHTECPTESACVRPLCVEGQCTTQAAVCDDGAACTADTCDDALGCVHTYVEDLGCPAVTTLFEATFDTGGTDDMVVADLAVNLGDDETPATWQPDPGQVHSGASALYFGIPGPYNYDTGKVV